jgi:hypothetical protein
MPKDKAKLETKNARAGIMVILLPGPAFIFFSKKINLPLDFPPQQSLSLNSKPVLKLETNCEQLRRDAGF